MHFFLVLASVWSLPNHGDRSTPLIVQEMPDIGSCIGVAQAMNMITPSATVCVRIKEGKAEFYPIAKR